MKILIVDDQEVLRKSVMVHLELIFSDAEIMECASGMESLNMIGRFDPDIIFMDISMPGMSGIQATRQIVAEYPGQRIIGFSMNDNMEMVEKMLSAGASAYLLKTDSMDDFKKAVEEVLEDHQFISPNIMTMKQ